MITFDIGYYPEERGPYNFDYPDGHVLDGDSISAGIELDGDEIKLKRPETRWGGIMRSFQNTDMFTILIILIGSKDLYIYIGPTVV